MYFGCSRCRHSIMSGVRRILMPYLDRWQSGMPETWWLFWVELNKKGENYNFTLNVESNSNL